MDNNQNENQGFQNGNAGNDSQGWTNANNGSYQNGGYQNGGYQNNSYQNNGYNGQPQYNYQGNNSPGRGYSISSYTMQQTERPAKHTLQNGIKSHKQQ